MAWMHSWIKYQNQIMCHPNTSLKCLPNSSVLMIEPFFGMCWCMCSNCLACGSGGAHYRPPHTYSLKALKLGMCINSHTGSICLAKSWMFSGTWWLLPIFPFVNDSWEFFSAHWVRVDQFIWHPKLTYKGGSIAHCWQHGDESIQQFCWFDCWQSTTNSCR